MDDVSDLNDQPDEPEGWTVSFKASGRRIPPHYHSLLRQVIDTLSANPSAVRPLLRRHFAEIDDSFFDLLAEWVDHLRTNARPELIDHISHVFEKGREEYRQYRHITSPGANGRRIPPYRLWLLRQVIDTLLANPSVVRPLLRRHFAEIDDSFFDLLAEWVDHLRADARPEVITHLSNILAIAHREYEQYRSYFPVTDKMW